MSPFLKTLQTAKSPWDTARKFKLQREDTFGNTHHLEPGVKFFILALEHLGCVTRFSCEGHPTGFYILFEGSLETADKIDAAGWFTLERFHGKWAIRFNEQHYLNELKYIPGLDSTPEALKKIERRKRKHLRQAALAWQQKFLQK